MVLITLTLWGKIGMTQVLSTEASLTMARTLPTRIVMDHDSQVRRYVRISRGYELNLRSTRPDRQRLLSNIRATANHPLREQLRDQLAEMECGTVCTTLTDQHWCRQVRANEWEEYDLVLPCRRDTGGCERCEAPNARNGACQWRRVQALSAYDCHSLRMATALQNRDAVEVAASLSKNLRPDRDTEARPLPEPNRAQQLDQDPLHTQLAAITQEAVRAEHEALRASSPTRTRRDHAVARHVPRTPYRMPIQSVTDSSIRPSVPLACSKTLRHDRSLMATCRIEHGFEPQILHQGLPLYQGNTSLPGLTALDQRLRPHRRVIAQIMRDNPGTRGQCQSPLLLACHARVPTSHPYVYQRLGVCRAVNGNDTPVTLASFVEVARTACSTDRITIQGVHGDRIRLRLRRTP